ncbi:MAG: haloacid dehalogenase type II [Actinomycetes bacterium]
MPPTQVVVFDVNETLTDMSPLRGRFEAVGAPPDMFDAWFAGTLRDGFALTAADAYGDFAAIARSVLTGLLTEVGTVGEPAEAAQGVIAGLPRLEVHADVPDGLRRLRDGGLRLVTLTNGSVEMSEGSLDRAGVLDLFEQRLSVSTPQRWKPAAEAYRWAAQAVGVDVGGMVLVAAHPWDVDGAARAGLVGAWLNRQERDYPPYFTEPHVRAGSLPALADALLAL